MWEPRGHADMYGAVVTPSTDADFDVFFLHNEGYSTMCGHAIIALTKLVFETGSGRRSAIRRVSFNVPAGRIDARAHVEGGQVREYVLPQRAVVPLSARQGCATSPASVTCASMLPTVVLSTRSSMRTPLGLELGPPTTTDSSIRATHQACRDGGDSRSSIRSSET